MTALYHTFLLFTVSMASLQPQRSSRSKRGLLELAGVIKCSTGRSALTYAMYGCYCGLGGQGWPRDRADWCCHKHDCCYGDAEFAGCQTKTDRYLWTCEEEEADCDTLNDRCAKILCRQGSSQMPPQGTVQPKICSVARFPLWMCSSYLQHLLMPV